MYSAVLSFWHCTLPYRSLSVLRGPIYLSVVVCSAWDIGVLFRKLSHVPLWSRLVFTFFSIKFGEAGFCWSHWSTSTWPVQGNKYGSIFILLHIDCQSDQHHLLKILSLSHCMVFYSLTNQVSISLSLFLGPQFCSIAQTALLCFVLFCFVLFCFVFYQYYSEVQIEVRDCDLSRSSFIVQNCFGYPGFFLFFHMKVKIAL